MSSCFAFKDSTDSPFPGKGTAILEPGFACGGTRTGTVVPGLLGLGTWMIVPGCPGFTAMMTIGPFGRIGFAGGFGPFFGGRILRSFRVSLFRL